MAYSICVEILDASNNLPEYFCSKSFFTKYGDLEIGTAIYHYQEACLS